MVLIRIVFYFLIIGLLSGCAQMVPLDGGPRDVTAPIPDTNNIQPPHGSVNTFPEKIRIPFNEFIRLNNASANIVIIPDINPKPTYKVKGKDLIIDLKDAQLDSNTTYSFYFNKVVQDISEGNDSIMNYVFATGAFIDSLTYEVMVLDAEQGVPVSQVLVGLYPHSDTLDPYVHKPKYFAQTNTEGKASFNYLAAGKFQVFAFGGSGGRLKPGLSDPIAFLTEPIFLDTLTTELDTMFLFPVLSERFQLKRKEIEAPGKVLVTSTRSFEDATFTIKKDSISVAFQIEKTIQPDSTILWFKGEENKAYQVKVSWPDTSLQTRLFLKKSITPVKVNITTNLDKDNGIEINDTLQLISSLPIQAIDPAHIDIRDEDSTKLDVEFELIDVRKAAVIYPFEAGKSYTMQLYPGAISNINEIEITDTIQFKFSRKEEKNYANLELILNNKPQAPLVLKLFKEKLLYDQQQIGVADTVLHFSLLNPGSYTIQIIRDENENGKWDSGSYSEKIQPEQCIWFRDPIILRANWDNSVTLEF